MKKKLLSLFVGICMLLPVFLTGCSEDGETIDVTETHASALTLTLYSIVEEGTTEAAIKAVQDALNVKTENELNTHVELKFYTADEYAAVLDAQFKEIQADMDMQARLKAAADVARKAARAAGYSVANKNAETEAKKPDETGIAETVEADETVINEYGIADTVYPDVIEGQLDVFLINSYSMYSDLISRGVLSALEGELSLGSKSITGYVYPALLNSASVGGHTYAVPNNHMVGEYTYMLVNKSIAQKYGFNESTFKTAASLYDSGFLARVSAGEAGAVLMLNDPECTIDYATGDEGLLGTYVTVPMSTTQKTYPPEIIYGIPTYKSILCAKNQFGASIEHGNVEDFSGRTIASAFLKGSYVDMQQYKDDYYVTVVDAPTYTMEDVCSGMYAVSAYSVDLSRSMEIIELLASEPDVVNLLAYGIEDVNYSKDDSSNVVELFNKEDSGDNYYRMNPSYAGNQYKRFITSDATSEEIAISADNWAGAKSQNLASVSLPYSGFVINTELVPTYIAPENSDESDDEDETDAVTDAVTDSNSGATEPETPAKTYMPVDEMLAGLEAVYKEYSEKVANFNGTDPDTGAAMSFSDYLDTITERLAENIYVNQALDECNSASVLNQYNAFAGA